MKKTRSPRLNSSGSPRLYFHKSEYGFIGLGRTKDGLCSLTFPQASLRDAKAALKKRYPQAHFSQAPKPPWMDDLAAIIDHILRPHPPGLKRSKILKRMPPLDFSEVAELDQRIYLTALAIPRGTVVSLRELGDRAGVKMSARKLLKVIEANPFPLLIPCHRIARSAKPTDHVTREHLLEMECGPNKPRKLDRSFDEAEVLDYLSRRDPKLGALIKKVGAFNLRKASDGEPFNWLLRSIIYQQLHGKAAATIHSRLRTLFGDRDPRPEEILSSAPEYLLGAGLSRQKLAAIRDLARAAQAGELPDRSAMLKMSDEEIIDAVTPIRGIGRWTVEMLLIFGLRRADILAVDDFAIRKAAGILHGLKWPQIRVNYMK